MKTNLREKAEHFLKSLHFSKRWAFLAIFIGLISGLGSVVFFYLLNISNNLFLGTFVNYHAPVEGIHYTTPFKITGYNYLMLPIITTIGGLISGFLVYTWAPEAEGHGTDAVIASFHNLRGVIRKRIPIIKTLSSVAVIGSGGSAGREGPIAQIGAGFGSWLDSFFHLSDRDRRIAVICGTAGGIGSIFKAPLGGAIFAIEVLYKRDLEADALISSFISSVIAYSVFSAFFGFSPIFATPKYFFENAIDLVFYTVLGLVCAVFAKLFVKIFYFTRDLFRKINIPNHFKPAIGGLVVGIIGIFVPEVLGSGYGWIQLAIDGQLILLLLIVLIFAKMITTAFTIGSGGSGGVFAPSLFIGAMLGSAFGLLVELIFPEVPVDTRAFVLVGMAAFFAGAAKVPIAAIVMVSEMTGNYDLLAPLILACATAYIFSGTASIYENQVLSRAHSPVHRGEFTVDLIEKVQVKDVMPRKVITVSPDDTIKHVSKLISETHHLGYPVVDETGKLVGIITYADVLRVPIRKAKKTKVKEIMTKKLVTIHPNDTLEYALRRMFECKHGHLPVVDQEDPTKLLGMISKSDIISGHEIIRRITHHEKVPKAPEE